MNWERKTFKAEFPQLTLGYWYKIKFLENGHLDRKVMHY